MTMPTNTELHEILDEVLSESISIMTGGEFDQPRPGQKALSHRILDTMLAATSVEPVQAPRGMIGRAPTGVGKSFAYLCAAYTVAALRGERSVISTESKSLQHQIVTKDAPIVRDAVKRVCVKHEKEPLIGLDCQIYQGWSNYVCLDRTARTLRTAAEEPGFEITDQDAVASYAAVLDSAAQAGRMASANELSNGKIGTRDVRVEMVGDVRLDDPARTARLLSWAVKATDDQAYQDAFEGSRPHWLEWSLVSTDTRSCRGRKCELSDICIPQSNRKACREAALVVTNHSMTATQATSGYATLIGSARIGVFDHIIVDEGHALPSITRDSGTVELSEQRIQRLARRAARLADHIANVADTGEILGAELESRLVHVLGRKDSTTLREGDGNVLDNLPDKLIDWIDTLSRLLPKVDQGHADFPRVSRVSGDLEDLERTVDQIRDHIIGYARWVERGRSGIIMKAAPVDVSKMLANRVYLAPVPRVPDKDPDFDPLQPFNSKRIPDHRWRYPKTEEAKEPEGDDEDIRREPEPFYPLSISSVSATLPESYGRDAGIPVRVEDFESPFADAYRNSVVYRADGFDMDILNATGSLSNGRYRLDPARHKEWAKDVIVQLVRANGGGALILSATAKAGQEYATALRQAGLGLDIFSQWDGSKEANVRAWREQENSVLVGTKSLMTGVDAPGQTCSLVVSDRVPRSPSNPIDDARIELLVEGGMNKWVADREVYARDAALLLDQLVGRLIRRLSDTGMVVTLDPRMVINSPASYPADTSAIYNAPFNRFGDATRWLFEAVGWLENHRLAHPFAE